MTLGRPGVGGIVLLEVCGIVCVLDRQAATGSVCEGGVSDGTVPPSAQGAGGAAPHQPGHTQCLLSL